MASLEGSFSFKLPGYQTSKLHELLHVNSGTFNGKDPVGTPVAQVTHFQFPACRLYTFS